MSDTDETLSDAERQDADLQAITEVIQKARVAMVTSLDADGALVSRPLGLAERAFDGELYFFTPDPSDKTEQIRRHPAVNVAIEDRGNYLSIAGTASVTKDRELIDQLWNPHAEAWFAEGREDPAIALLTVHADSAELQSIDKPRVVALAKYAAALITKKQPDLGDGTRVDF